MAGQSERSKQSKVSRKQVIYLELAVKEPITSEVMQVTTNQKRGRRDQSIGADDGKRSVTRIVDSNEHRRRDRNTSDDDQE